MSTKRVKSDKRKNTNRSPKANSASSLSLTSLSLTSSSSHSSPNGHRDEDSDILDQSSSSSSSPSSSSSSSSMPSNRPRGTIPNSDAIKFTFPRAAATQIREEDLKRELVPDRPTLLKNHTVDVKETTNRLDLDEAYDFLIEVANENEWQMAVLFIRFDLKYKLPHGQWIYVGRFKQSPHASCVIVHSSNQGSYHASMICARALNSFRFRVVFGIGCGFGFRENAKKDEDIQHKGDVMVSLVIAPYESVRLGEQTINRNVSTRLRSQLEDEFRDGKKSFHLFLRDEQNRPRKLKIHIGAMLSGEKLVDDPKVKHHLTSLVSNSHSAKDKPQVQDAHIIGGEMEGAGLALACQYYNNVPCVIVKGVADYGQGKAAGEQVTGDKEYSQRVASYAAFYLVNQMQQHQKLMKISFVGHNQSKRKRSGKNEEQAIPETCEETAQQCVLSALALQAAKATLEVEMKLKESQISDELRSTYAEAEEAYNEAKTKLDEARTACQPKLDRKIVAAHDTACDEFEKAKHAFFHQYSSDAILSASTGTIRFSSFLAESKDNKYHAQFRLSIPRQNALTQEQIRKYVDSITFAQMLQDTAEYHVKQSLEKKTAKLEVDMNVAGGNGLTENDKDQRDDEDENEDNDTRHPLKISRGQSNTSKQKSKGKKKSKHDEVK